MLAWFTLVLAGLFEIVWAIGLKHTDGFTRPVPSMITLFAMGMSAALLAFAVRTLPIGISYAIWTGIGVAGTALAASLFEREPLRLTNLLFLLLILIGMAGLKVTAGS